MVVTIFSKHICTHYDVTSITSIQFVYFQTGPTNSIVSMSSALTTTGSPGGASFLAQNQSLPKNPLMGFLKFVAPLFNCCCWKKGYNKICVCWQKQVPPNCSLWPNSHRINLCHQHSEPHGSPLRLQHFGSGRRLWQRLLAWKKRRFRPGGCEKIPKTDGYWDLYWICV